MSIWDYIHKYAPAKDKNNPVKYTQDMVNRFNKAIGKNVITKDTSLGELKESLMEAGLDPEHTITKAHLQTEDPTVLRDLNKVQTKQETKTPTKPQVLAPKKQPKVNPNPTFKLPTIGEQPTTKPKEEKENTQFSIGNIANKIGTTQPKPVTQPTSKIEEPSLMSQAMETLQKEGIGSLTSQAYNKIVEPDKGLEQKIAPKPTVIQKPVTTTKQPEKVQEPSKVSIGGKIDNYKGDANRYIEPFRVNVNSSKFGVRSRGEKQDIKTEGVVFTTFKPWTYASSPQYTDEFNYYLLVDSNSGNLKVTTTPKDKGSLLNDSKIKANPKMLTTGTYGRLAKELNLKGKYNKGIETATLGYVNTDGKQASLPTFGIGSGNDLGGYKGGKLILTKPDGSDPVIVYGSALIVIKEFNEYKKKHNISNVLVLDADGKSYAQSLQTKNKTIKGEFLTSKEWDNANSASAGSGNILYLK